MASVGVPFVASPTEPYRWLAKLGAGVLARDQDEWRRELRSLICDQDRRAELAASGVRAAEQLTIEGNAHLWAEAWGLS
jgi:spore maturation protein CgeB